MKKACLFACCAVLSGVLLAQHSTPNAPLFQKGFPVPQAQPDASLEIRAEACAPATALRDLEWNNVRALIENAGALWYDRAIDRSLHGSEGRRRFCGVWRGAVVGRHRPDQQLKPLLCGTGTSETFLAGAVDKHRCGEVDPTTCSATSGSPSPSGRTPCFCPVLRLHRHPDCDLEEQFPNGYTIPSYFFEYPAHGNVGLTKTTTSPFKDYDGNGF